MGKTSKEVRTSLVGDDVGAGVAAVPVGEAVGGTVGVPVGEAVGEAVGVAIGDAVGEAVGVAVGDAVGLREGAFVASGMVGAAVVGVPVGLVVGDAVGVPVGLVVGTCVGEAVGDKVGACVGEVVGTFVGASVAAVVLGVCDSEGMSEGISVGVVLGESCQEISLSPHVSPVVIFAQHVTISVPVAVPSFSRRNENGSFGLDSVEATIPSFGPPPVVVQVIGKAVASQQGSIVPPGAINVVVRLNDVGPEVVTV
mmetsp:Transcript_45404/g.67427  ORF Transcript_45404/g.67427 Transcript_45404/m.67427 type:complete len:254 (-) Transcript_45404:1797-2558(-)